MIHSLYICYIGLQNNYQACYYAVVLGNKVNEDGSLSLRLKARLDKSIELYQRKFIYKIIVSGGLGKEGFYEAEKMKDYLLLNGVSDSNIIIDNYGNNTIGTCMNAKKIIQDKSQKLMIISQYHHLFRCKTIFENEGFQKVYLASPMYFELRDIYALIREFFAYYSYQLNNN